MTAHVTSHRYGDLPSDGGPACRYRRKLDRALAAACRHIGPRSRRQSVWNHVRTHWATLLERELLRGEPQQTGWADPSHPYRMLKGKKKK